jgi:hypothetical protein
MKITESPQLRAMLRASLGLCLPVVPTGSRIRADHDRFGRSGLPGLRICSWPQRRVAFRLSMPLWEGATQLPAGGHPSTQRGIPLPATTVPSRPASTSRNASFRPEGPEHRHPVVFGAFASPKRNPPRYETRVEAVSTASGPHEPSGSAKTGPPTRVRTLQNAY